MLNSLPGTKNKYACVAYVTIIRLDSNSRIYMYLPQHLGSTHGFVVGFVLLIFLVECVVGFVLYVFTLYLVPTLPVSLDCPYMIASSAFSTFWLHGNCSI